MMEITYTIDWLSVTSDRAHYHDQMTMYCIERERGSKGYTVVIEFEDGRLEMLNPDRPEMGVHVEYSGSALEAIERDYNIPKMEVLALGQDAIKTTRLDIAVDVMSSGLDIGDLVTAIDYGYMKSSATKSFEIKSINEPGHTLYIGAPSSEARLRIYDKAAEQSESGDWKRIELQLRSVKARNARQQLLGSTDVSASIKSIINNFARFDLPIWERIMSREISPSLPGERHKGGTEKWLLTTVAKSLAGMVSRDDGNDFMLKFLRSMNGYRQEAEEKRQKRASWVNLTIS